MTDKEKEYAQHAGAGAAIGAAIGGAGAATAYAAPRIAKAKALGHIGDKVAAITASESGKLWGKDAVNKASNALFGVDKVKDLRHVKVPFLNDGMNKAIRDKVRWVQGEFIKGAKAARNAGGTIGDLAWNAHKDSIKAASEKTAGQAVSELIDKGAKEGKFTVGSKIADQYIKRSVKPNAIKAGLKGGVKGLAAGALSGLLYKTVKDGSRKVNLNNYYMLDNNGNVVREFNNRDSAMAAASDYKNYKVNKGTTLVGKGVTDIPVKGNTFGNRLVEGYRKSRDDTGMRMMNYSFIGDFIERDLAGGVASVAAGGAAKKLGQGPINQLLASIGGYIAGYKEMGKRQESKERLMGDGYRIYPNKYYITCITDGKPNLELYELNGYDDKHSLNLAMALAKPNKNEHLNVAIGKDLLKEFPKIFKLAKY